MAIIHRFSVLSDLGIHLLCFFGCAVLPIAHAAEGEEDDACQSMTLTLEAATVALTDDLEITTRLINGTYPGPTLTMRPGECWHIHFVNALEAGLGRPFLNNALSAPQESNLHFHGLHIDGELPSDDTSLVVLPGDSYTYTIHLPDHHMPGTHWLHPHRHGSSSLQVGGGAVAAVIVSDDKNATAMSLPQALQALPERLFLVHDLDFNLMEEITRTAQDGLWKLAATGRISESGYFTVNGQVRPEVPISADTWTRVRIIWAAWREGNLDWTIQPSSAGGADVSCEMQLFAKDGIYIRDVPRPISMAPLVPGGRADVLVKCPAGEYIVTGPRGVPLARLVVAASPDGSSSSTVTNLPSWTPTYPPYLEDLRQSPPSPNCSCAIHFDRRAVNGRSYNSGDILHQSYIGAVVEREVRARNHPYHQHVYPFQIQQGFGINGNGGGGGRDNDNRRDDNDNGNRDNDNHSSGNFYQAGDWHDSVDGTGILRYRPTEFTGKLMFHCHRLVHEDEGMMAMEYVHEADEGNSVGCACGSSAATSLWTTPFPLSLFPTPDPLSLFPTAAPRFAGMTNAPTSALTDVSASAMMWRLFGLATLPWIATWVATELII